MYQVPVLLAGGRNLLPRRPPSSWALGKGDDPDRVGDGKTREALLSIISSGKEGSQPASNIQKRSRGQPSETPRGEGMAAIVDIMGTKYFQ